MMHRWHPPQNIDVIDVMGNRKGYTNVGKNT